MRLSFSKLKQKSNEKTDASAGRNGKSEGDGAVSTKVKLDNLVEELTRAKRSAMVMRSAKTKVEEALNISKKREIEALDDVAKIEDEMQRYRKNTADARKERDVALSKAKRALSKMKELTNGADSADGKEDKENVSALKKKISCLADQNVSLRSALAGKKLKVDGVVKPNPAQGLSARHLNSALSAEREEHIKKQQKKWRTKKRNTTSR